MLISKCNGKHSLGVQKFHTYFSWSSNYRFHPDWIENVVFIVEKVRSYGWQR